MKWLLAALLTGLLFFSLGTNAYKKGSPSISVFNTTTLASGDLTVNAINLATAPDTYDIPDGACNAAEDVGTWVTVVARDAAEVIIISSADASNVFNVPLLSLDPGDVLDMVSDANGEGGHITLVCLAADQWYSTSLHYLANGAIGWADGDAS